MKASIKDGIKRVDDIFEELAASNFSLSPSPSPSNGLSHQPDPITGIAYIGENETFSVGFLPNKLMQLHLDNNKAKDLELRRYQKKEFPEMSKWTPKFEQDSAI
jgi:hypothetical protein